MKNKKGYTIVELIVVIAVVGILAFVMINKASYAFSDQEEANKELVDSRIELIELQAKKYGEEHKEIFNKKNVAYINVEDLVESNYLLVSNLDKNNKIKLEIKDDKVKATLEK